MHNNNQNYPNASSVPTGWMSQQGIGGSCLAGVSGIVNSPPEPPAQRPSEFIGRLLNQAEELNSRLQNLRYRLFGDSDGRVGPENAVLPKEASIESTIQATHYALKCAIDQMEAVQNRL